MPIINNPDTLVSVHCYNGDADQVEAIMPFYRHHPNQVVVVSPTDSPAIIHANVEVDLMEAGLVGYVGQVSLDRQLAQMKALLENYQHNYFLMHDSDSVALDPQLPGELYADSDAMTVWSNVVPDTIPCHQPEFPQSWPHVAFQPPYFLTRKAMQALIDAAPLVKMSPVMPFIDFYMVQLTMAAGLTWKRLPYAASFAMTPRPGATLTQAQEREYNRNWPLALNAVENEGVQFIHSIKDGNAVRELVRLHRIWKSRQ